MKTDKKKTELSPIVKAMLNGMFQGAAFGVVDYMANPPKDKAKGLKAFRKMVQEYDLKKGRR